MAALAFGPVIPMMKALLLIGLLAAAGLAFVPAATATPNCEVDTGELGVGVVCSGGTKPLGLCVIVLYDTNFVMWASPGCKVPI
jgi:hypothetical protein